MYGYVDWEVGKGVDLTHRMSVHTALHWGYPVQLTNPGYERFCLVGEFILGGSVINETPRLVNYHTNIHLNKLNSTLVYYYLAKMYNSPL